MAPRTKENCTIRKKYECEIIDSYCEGIQRSEYDDEPAPPCDECKFTSWYDPEEIMARKKGAIP